MMPTTSPLFDLALHRRIAAQVISGEAAPGDVADSQAALLKEIIRLTGALPLSAGTLVLAENFGQLIAALAKVSRAFTLYTEVDGNRSVAGEMGSYRGYHDHLRISPDGVEPWTAGQLLKQLRDIKRTGFPGAGGGHYTAEDNTPVWICNASSTSDWILAGIRVDDSELTLVAKENPFW